jgi:hypothetical protein
MEDGTINSIGQKPLGFRQTDNCEFHLRRQQSSIFSQTVAMQLNIEQIISLMYCTVITLLFTLQYLQLLQEHFRN